LSKSGQRRIDARKTLVPAQRIGPAGTPFADAIGGCSFDANQEQAFEGLVAVLLTGMEIRDMALHCFTSRGCEKELSLQIRPSRSSFAERELRLFKYLG
jgi:hypothetical protein